MHRYVCRYVHTSMPTYKQIYLLVSRICTCALVFFWLQVKNHRWHNHNKYIIALNPTNGEIWQLPLTKDKFVKKQKVSGRLVKYSMNYHQQWTIMHPEHEKNKGPWKIHYELYYATNARTTPMNLPVKGA